MCRIKSKVAQKVNYKGVGLIKTSGDNEKTSPTVEPRKKVILKLIWNSGKSCTYC